MSNLLWALGATAASMALMYVVCLRPMRRGRGHCAPAEGDPARDQVAQLRREIAALRERAGQG